MECDREAMCLVANQLHQVKHGRMVIEHHRFNFLAVDVDNFFAFGNGSQGLINDFQRVECLGGSVQLPKSAVDQDQARHTLLFILNTLVAACDHLAHGGEIVHACYALDNEFPVVGFFHLAVFPDNHGGDCLGTLNMRDIETFNSLWQLRKDERILQRLLNGALAGLHHAEALVKRLLGVVAGKVDERSLLATLRHDQMNACSAATLSSNLVRQEFFQHLPIFEVHGDVYVAGQIWLADVELFQQGREELTGVECVIAGGVGKGSSQAGGRDAGGSAGKIGQVFPEEFPAIENFPASHMKQIYRQHAILIVEAKDVGIITVGRGHPLFFLQLLDSGD